MTKPKQYHQLRKAVFRLDECGYPKFVASFMAAEDSDNLAAGLGDGHVSLTYGEYLAIQDPDDESRAREARRLARNQAVRPNDKPRSCVITGTIAGHTRESAAAHMRAMGWQVMATITSATQYLITGDKPGQSKLVKARALGVQQIQWESV